MRAEARGAIRRAAAALARRAAALCLGLGALATGAAAPADGFTFLAYGDNRAGNGCGGNAVHLSLVRRMLREPADMVFNLGDMVVGYDRSTNWVRRGDCPRDDSHGSFKEAIAPLQARRPGPGLPAFYFPVVGNHDDNWNDGWYPDAFGHGFCDVFDPSRFVSNHTRGPHVADPRAARLSDEDFRAGMCSTRHRGVYPDLLYYALRHRQVLFIVLRLNGDYHDLLACNRPCDNPADYDRHYNRHQLDWLRWQLQQASGDPGVRHVVVLLHAPLVTSSWGHAANVSWPVLGRLFSEHGVRLVLSGHNHVYERSHPVRMDDASPAGRRDEAAGTTYVVTGGGGSSLHGFRGPHPLIAQARAEHHFLRVAVQDDALVLEALRPDGERIDRVVMRRPVDPASGEVVVPAPASGTASPVPAQGGPRP